MDRDDFTQRFRALVVNSGISLDDYAGACRTSRLTIRRWVDGVSAPHRLGRESALAAAAGLGQP